MKRMVSSHSRGAAGLRRAVALVSAVVFVLGLAACGGSSSNIKPGAILIATLTPAPQDPGGAIPTGGKPAAPSTTAVAPTPAPLPTSVAAPTTGRWIDVDVSKFVVRLMEGNNVIKLIQPVGVGAQIDTGAYESTQTGLFHVYDKRQELQYDAPYKTYISDWVGFDPAKANGFHSFLKDEKGNVVDPSTGRISNGCIRSGDSALIYDFAQIGMPVVVHT
ncbi:MAG TPA: L,D-transpeptidase family protein [Dehalococcoidia bacterium]